MGKIKLAWGMQMLKRKIIFFLEVFKIEILKLEQKDPPEMEKN